MSMKLVEEPEQVVPFSQPHGVGKMVQPGPAIPGVLDYLKCSPLVYGVEAWD